MALPRQVLRIVFGTAARLAHVAAALVVLACGLGVSLAGASGPGFDIPAIAQRQNDSAAGQVSRPSRGDDTRCAEHPSSVTLSRAPDRSAMRLRLTTAADVDPDDVDDGPDDEAPGSWTDGPSGDAPASAFMALVIGGPDFGALTEVAFAVSRGRSQQLPASFVRAPELRPPIRSRVAH